MRGPPGCSVLRAPGPVCQHRAHRRTSVILGPVVCPFSLHSGTLFGSLGGLLKYIPLIPSSFEERTHSRRRASVFRRHPLLPPLTHLASLFSFPLLLSLFWFRPKFLLSGLSQWKCSKLPGLKSKLHVPAVLISLRLWSFHFPVLKL